MIILTRYTLLILCIVVFSGCASPPPDTRAAQLKIVIAKYNNALIEAYKNRFDSPLMEVAGEAEVRKIRTIVDSFLQSDEIMEAEVKRMDFKEIKIEAEKAEVKTSEDWQYRWVNVRTGKEVEPIKDIHYEMLYHLIKKDGKWLVENTEDIGEEKRP